MSYPQRIRNFAYGTKAISSRYGLVLKAQYQHAAAPPQLADDIVHAAGNCDDGAAFGDAAADAAAAAAAVVGLPPGTETARAKCDCGVRRPDDHASEKSLSRRQSHHGAGPSLSLTGIVFQCL